MRITPRLVGDYSPGIGGYSPSGDHTHECEKSSRKLKKGKQFYCSNKSFKSISFDHNHLDIQHE